MRIEEIRRGSSCFLFFSDDFYFPRLPEDEQLLVLPVMLKSLRMSGVGKCRIGVRLPEDSEDGSLDFSRETPLSLASSILQGTSPSLSVQVF